MPGKAAFAKTEKMRTAKSMVDNNRQQAKQLQDQQYLGPPPPNPSVHLFQAVLVLPRAHLLPRGLEEPECFHDICLKHEIYITRTAPNVLDIKGASILNVQQAMKAIHWKLHNLRLSNDHPTVRFLLQEPIRAVENAKIKVVLGARPHFLLKKPEVQDIASAMDLHLPQLVAEITKTAPTLLSLNKHLRMRVNFGFLNARQKKKGSPDQMTQAEFAKLLNQYSIRGGASLETKLPEVSQAGKAFAFLTDPANGVCEDLDDVRTVYELSFALTDHEIITEILVGKGAPQLVSVHTIQPETWGRMNWTVAAPDMKFDWNFRVDAWAKGTKLPSGFESLPQKVRLMDPREEPASPGFKFPGVSTAGMGELEKGIGQIRLKSSYVIPFKESPYVLELSVTKTWEGGRITGSRALVWGIEFYAAHWDETINYISPEDGRKDWGAALESIWSGEDSKLEGRLRDFVRTVLEVQSLLEAMGAK